MRSNEIGGTVYFGKNLKDNVLLFILLNDIGQTHGENEDVWNISNSFPLDRAHSSSDGCSIDEYNCIHK